MTRSGGGGNKMKGHAGKKPTLSGSSRGGSGSYKMSGGEKDKPKKPRKYGGMG